MAMAFEIDVLALENWYDLLCFLSRPQLGQIATSISNRRFASIVQGFLHKYLQQITLPPINVSKTPNDDENDPPKAIVNLWHSDRWSTEELPLADWPMPDNITNFESINLSYLDLLVLRFLQKFQLNFLFTDVHLHFHTWYMNSKLAAVAQIFSHVLPLITSVDSILLDGSNLRPCSLWLLWHPRATFDDFSEVDWLCNWLYNPRTDQKARVLMLFQGAGYYHTPLLERLKGDFSEAKEAVTFFIGIQIGYFGPDSTMPIPDVSTKQLTNSKTHERMSITVRKPSEQFRGRVEHDYFGPAFMLISRHPLAAAQEWIDECEKDILEWKTHKHSRKIELNGFRIGIFPVEDSPPPPPPVPPNLFRKTFLSLKRMWK